MAITDIKLNYVSVERFLSDYSQLRKGSIFLPAKASLPDQTSVALHIFIPVLEQTVVVEGAVSKADDARAKKQGGIFICLKKNPAAALQNLNDILSTHEDYRVLLDLPPPDPASREKVNTASESSPEELKPPEGQSSGSTAGEARLKKSAKSDPPVEKTKATYDNQYAANQRPDGEQLTTLLPVEEATIYPSESQPIEEGTFSTPESHVEDKDALSMSWIRNAILQEEPNREIEIDLQISDAPKSVKQQLTEWERSRVKPAGDFLMALTKAMLRGGHDTPDHAGTQSTKEDLFKAFQKCRGESGEISITRLVTQQSSEILVTGILDDPVNIRLLFGSGMSEFLVPKLQEYFDRINLVSFAIKKDIPLNHFEIFMDIMSDSQADMGTRDKNGELLSKALVEHGITQISTVFKDDLIALELNLPWRVEMAIQRLAKDLTILPMFKSESEEADRMLKFQVIQDILRPLNHPQYLRDLIVHFYIIAQHLKGQNVEDIEKAIIETFPLESLLPTSQLIFNEFNRLREMQDGQHKHAILERRLASIKRILKWIAKRLMREGVKEVQVFIEKLHLNQVLTFEELPADVQYFANTRKMTGDVKNHVGNYVNRFLQVKSEEDAVILLKLFRRIIPDLIEGADWQIIHYLSRAAEKSAKTTEFFKSASGLPANPLTFVFEDQAQKIAIAYDNVDDAQRTMLNDISDRLDMLGIEILSKALSDCEDRSARKAAMAALIKKGNMSRDWTRKVLDSPDQKWYLIRNALMLLSYVGQAEEDLALAVKFMRHGHPRVRDEALKLVIRFNSSSAEEFVINALDDVDDKVRWRAMNGLKQLTSISERSVKKVLDRVTADIPEDKEFSGKHYRKMAQYIQALGSINHLPHQAGVEETILDIAVDLSNQTKGLLKRFKKSSAQDQSIVLSAAVTALGNIGGAKSEPFLEKLGSGKSPHAESAQKAANNIKLRTIEQLSNKPD